MVFRRWRRKTKGVTVPVPDGAGRVDCQVVDPVGLPMRADVSIINDDGQSITQGGSDPYGMFLAAVPPGDYQLSVAADGFQPQRTPVHITAQTNTSAGTIQLDTMPQPPLPTPGRWDIDPAHTAIRFSARHIGLADIHGRFNNFYGTAWIGERIEDSRLEVVIDAASIDTGVPMRDDHLRSSDFLDVGHHPYLYFTCDRFLHHGGSRWTVSGVLHLHGVARTVRLDTTYLGLGTGMEGETRAACKATTELHREDFTLNWQKMLARGITVVGPRLRVELDIQLVNSNAP